MPYKKSKKISRRRNKRGTKHRSKRFRKSKRKTKYHKRGGAGWLDGFKKMIGQDEESVRKRQEKTDCIKKQDEIIKQAKEAKKNCGKTESTIVSNPMSTSSYNESNPLSNQEEALQEPVQSTATAPPPRAIEARPSSGEGPDGPVGGKNGRKKKSKRKRRTKHH